MTRDTDSEFDDPTPPPMPSRPADVPVGQAIADQTPGWNPLRPGDLDDAHLLSQEVRLLRGEVRDVSAGQRKIGDAVEKLTEQVMAVVRDLAARTTKLEQRADATEHKQKQKNAEHDDQIAALTGRLVKLETAAKKRLRR